MLPISELEYPIHWDFFESWLFTIRPTTQSLNYRANSYHIHVNNLNLHARGREISPQCPCSNQPINTSLPNACLLPSDSNLQHLLSPAATPTSNHAIPTSKNLSQQQPWISSCVSILSKIMAINFNVPAVCFAFVSFYYNSFCPCKFI